MKNNVYSFLKIVSISFITIIQMIIFLKGNLSKEDNTEKTIPIVETQSTIKDVREELYSINNLSIIEMEDKNNKWFIKVVIEDKRENVKEALAKLEKYTVEKYSLQGNNEIVSLYLDICR